jgi:integrase
MARKRYQNGQLWLEGKSWYGRWREDVLVDGVVRRVRRKEKIGSKADYPTRPLAQRAFADRIAHVNRIGYRPARVARFSDFARSWETNVLSQYGESTAINYRTHVRKHIVPFFGAYSMREITTELVQQFVAGLKVSRKTARNILITLKAMWNKAKEWGYASDGVTEGVVLPKSKRRQRFFASEEQIQRIVTAAAEPYRTFYGLAAETGLRPGELCGLTVDDLDLQRGMLQVHQSAWRGKLGDPKTLDSIRVVELSSRACVHLQQFLLRWQPNDRRLLFATRNGTPWDQNLLLKRKFKPLLAALGIKVPRGDGFYIFRHGNATLMSSFGAPQKLRQERLGHADGSPVTETIYTHVISEDGKRIAARLGEAVWGILDPNGPKNSNGSGVEPPKPFVVN